MVALDYSEIPSINVVSSVDELDPSGYVAANADLRVAGLDVVEHYRRYGYAEGRQQVEFARIAAERQRKLARVLFSRSPVEHRPLSDPQQFISTEQRVDFELPDAVPIASTEYNGYLAPLIRDNPGSLFLDVGAGFSKTYYSNVVTTDVGAHPTTDVICVGEDLPFESEQFDGVFCIAVLEHTKYPWQVVPEIVRVLKPGGLIYIDWPFLQPVHGYPHHYFNATPKGLQSQFEGTCDIESVDVALSQHPAFALEVLLREWRNGLSPERVAEFDRLTIGEIVATPPIAIACAAFSQELSKERQAIIAAGSTLIGRKKARQNG